MTTGLRATLYRGGGYLAFRQGVGVVLSAAGVLLLTRLLGPAPYGVFAAAVSLQLVLQAAALWGVNAWLIRHDADTVGPRFAEASSFLGVTALLALLAGTAALPLIEGWTRLDGLAGPGLALFAVLPLQLAGTVPLARLERALDFRNVARIELAGQLLFLLVAVPLAVRGAGVWAPVAGFVAQQAAQALGYFRAARYRPRWRWSAEANREMLRFGLGYSTSMWIWQGRRLVNPLVVGRFLGAEAVGYVAVATQIATQLGFVAVAAWRLSTAALARLQRDAERTGAALSEGMHLQALAVGPPLVAFGWLGGWLVPLFFGAAWDPVMRVYPGIALAFLTNAVFLLHSSALYVRDRSWEVTAFHLANVGALAVAAVLLVPRYGLVGYAWAEVVAIASYLVLHGFTVRRAARPAYGRAAPAWGAFALALLLPGHPVAGLLLLAGVLALPPTRQVIGGVWRELRSQPHGA